MSSPASLASAWSRAWRVPATGFCFACFGIGGLLMGVLAFPLINLVVRDPVRRIRWSRALVGASFRGFIGLMTLLGLSLPALFSGAVFVEAIFAWPGVGQVLVQAVQARDYPVVMAASTLSALLVVAGNLLAEFLLTRADPRLRERHAAS